MIISQLSMKSCLKSNNELTLGMQNAHDEHKSSMDEMIMQASLLANIMREMQEDRARSHAEEQRLGEDSTTEPEKEEPSSTELELEMHQGEVRAIEEMLAKEESQVGEESIAMPLNDVTSWEVPEVENNEPQRGEEEVIQRCLGFNATLFYLHARTVHLLDEKVERLVSREEGENAQVER